MLSEADKVLQFKLLHEGNSTLFCTVTYHGWLHHRKKRKTMPKFEIRNNSLWKCEFVVLKCVLSRWLWMCCKCYFCSFDLCGQSEPREDDKSDQTSMSQRLRDNPAVCHLNSFRGGGCIAGKKSKEADRTSDRGETKRGERNVWLI